MIIIVAVIDAELAEGGLRRFPNLACMKIAGYYKNKGKGVILKTGYENLQDFEKVYISKTFTKTKCDLRILCLPNVVYGGTGFFYEDAPSLPYDFEHSFPYYNLYSGYIKEQLQKGRKAAELKCFTDYSIGLLTRGCFRKCGFCVNKKYDYCIKHSPLEEFYDCSRKKIMCLDDNILAYPDWRQLIEELCATGKPFTMKQGIDIRLVCTDFIKLINQAKYDGDLIFSFDNIADSQIIERKLSIFREHSNMPVRMYLFCGYDHNGRYSMDFWLADIENIFKRLEIIGKYQVSPYLMRYEKYHNSPFAGLYKTIATYCNFSGIFKLISFKQYCENERNKSKNKDRPCSEWRYYADFVRQYPHYEARFFTENYYRRLNAND